MRRTALALAQKTMGFTKQLIREGVSAAWAIGFSFRSLFLVEQNGYLHVMLFTSNHPINTQPVNLFAPIDLFCCLFPADSTRTGQSLPVVNR